jgi:hypothetical protein
MPIVNNQSWDIDGDLIHDEWVDVPYGPLTGHQVVATLNAVLSVWTLADAANVAGVPADHLVAEAQAWAAAQEQS